MITVKILEESEMSSNSEPEKPFRYPNNFKPTLSTEEQLYILNNHPFFTGICPKCQYKYDTSHRWQIDGKCPGCNYQFDKKSTLF